MGKHSLTEFQKYLLRSRVGYVNPESNKEKSRNRNSLGMGKLRSGTVRSEIGTGAKSPWEPACDSESTVVLARLQDDKFVMSPTDIQRSIYSPIRAAITTPGGKNKQSTRIIPTSTFKK